MIKVEMATINRGIKINKYRQYCHLFNALNWNRKLVLKKNILEAIVSEGRKLDSEH